MVRLPFCASTWDALQTVLMALVLAACYRELLAHKQNRSFDLAELPAQLGGPLALVDFARLSAEPAGQAAARARAIGRQLLGLDAEARVVFVTGAGTPVWDELLQALLDSYGQRPPEYSVVVLSPHQARLRNVRLRTAEATDPILSAAQ